ncbi:Dolichyl-phosphate beta-D-mannosyltransferase protein [Halorhabdus tiamatea SARL4B]|uniref:Dolichyl-phosphate beta-D-mannosyltransferase protein n=1 Tax=Halorhabdus tiamatea SARL4B TaxID=1033806 RepID=F7PGN0_9EURY|nr:glycosyltransferase [Halorhabdus tiamatea]ERJ05051.1 Dolichyl-phosphate beta-D-mannosyltransferase protein [Halorhabdus tiamatea SARL4B]CCQ33082.1 glycosyltransferase [Halorhabdus tiamatea SARL4B]
MATEYTRSNQPGTEGDLGGESTGYQGEGNLLGPGSDVDPALSVVLPTLNEERGIEVCIEQIKDAVETMDVTAEIIVSDSKARDRNWRGLSEQSHSV